jgi:hypothetical protein
MEPLRFYWLSNTIPPPTPTSLPLKHLFYSFNPSVFLFFPLYSFFCEFILILIFVPPDDLG